MLYAEKSFLYEQSVFTWDMNGMPAGVRVKGRYTLDDVQRVLSNEETGLPSIGIPFIFVRDQIQSGGMLNKQFEDCLVVKNAEHPDDYFHFVFTVRTTGIMTSIGFYRSGISLRSGKQNLRDERKSSSSLFENILGAVTKTDDRGLAEEYDYYAIAADIIKASFGV